MAERTASLSLKHNWIRPPVHLLHPDQLSLDPRRVHFHGMLWGSYGGDFYSNGNIGDDVLLLSLSEMKRIRDDIKMQMNEVETVLALGSNPKQATISQVKRALVIGLTPVLDSTKTIGRISLPGTMTGLIMGWASQLEAIQLQIEVMNMTIGASTASSMMSMFLSWPNLFA